MAFSLWLGFGALVLSPMLRKENRGLAMRSKESENWLTPEEWKKKMERKRKKQKEILPKESDVYEMDKK
jgi:hypothetical protein